MMMDFKRDLDDGIAPLRVAHAKRAFYALAVELLERFSGSFTESERIATLSVIEAFELAQGLDTPE
jgi:hypothetical protein